jgi:hypothetical protein
VLAGLCSSASAQPTSLATVAEGDADEGGRVYLSQSLAALQWAALSEEPRAVGRMAS